MGKEKKTALLTNHTQQIINFCPPKPADKKKEKGRRSQYGMKLCGIKTREDKKENRRKLE